MDLITTGLVALGLIVLISLLLILTESKIDKSSGKDWYGSTDEDSEIQPLLGVVSPKKENKDTKNKKGKN